MMKAFYIRDTPLYNPECVPSAEALIPSEDGVSRKEGWQGALEYTDQPKDATKDAARAVARFYDLSEHHGSSNHESKHSSSIVDNSGHPRCQR